MADIRAILLFLVATSAPAAWLKVQSEHFELFTSAGASAGRKALQRLEQARHVFETRVGTLSSLPVRVVLFRSESEFAPFNVRRGAAGYYTPGADRDYIAMQASSEELPRIVFHEYVHLLMRHAGVQVPVWLNEGTAEVYSTLESRGGQVHIGGVIPSHLRTLRSESLLDLKVLLDVGTGSPHYNEEDKTGIFYAQSWALAHMLNFSPAYQSGFPNLIVLLSTGEEPARAFQQAFGKGLNGVRNDLANYIQQNRFAGIRFEAPPVQHFTAAAATPVSDVASTLMLIDLMVTIRRFEAADAMLAKLAGTNRQHPEVIAALGDSAGRRGDDAAARDHYARAIELGSRSARLRYDYALVQRELGASEAAVEAALLEAINLDPKLFDAHFLLGYMRLKNERHAEALTNLQTASLLRPLEGAVWEHLALAHHALGNKADALSAARKARRLSNTPEDIARTDAMIQMVENDSVVQNTLPPPGRTGDETRAKPAETVKAEGSLVQVDCVDGRARLHVLRTAGKLYLLVTNPRNVTLGGVSSYQMDLPCGPVQPRPVVVEYRPSPNKAWSTVGEATSIEFR